MKILVTHSSSLDFEKKLYEPIKGSSLFEKNEVILPQEGGERNEITRETIKSCDLLIAEVSLPSTGQGIELGQARVFDVPVICVYEKDADISESLEKITDIFIEYENENDLIDKLSKQIEELIDL